MASFVTNYGAAMMTAGGVADVWSTGTIRARLVAASITPGKDDTSIDGYTAIGTDSTLTSKTKTTDTATDRIVYTAAGSTWAAVAAGSTFGWVVVYRFVTSDSLSTPICVVDCTDTPTNGSDIVWTVSASGICYLQQ